MQIKAGKDIFSVGDVIDTSYGKVRITGKRTLVDSVLYDVETTHGQILTPYQRHTAWENGWIKVRGWFSK